MKLLTPITAAIVLAATALMCSVPAHAGTPVNIVDGNGKPISGSNPLPTGSSVANFTPFQVSVGTTATLLAAARTGRQSITIINPAAVVLCYGNTGVTITTGECLPAIVGAARTIQFTGALYAVFASSSATVPGSESY